MVTERLRNVVREFPRDLGVILALVAIVNLSLFLPAGPSTPVRLSVELLLVLLLPGYAVVAALFPEAGGDAASGADGGSTPSNASATGATGGGDGIDTLERVVFSFALSVAVVSLVGLVLNYTPWGLRRVPLVATISGLVVVATVVATLRRMRIPPEKRYTVDAGRRLGIVRAELLGGNRTTDTVLTVLLAVGVVLAVTSVGYAVSVPTENERLTEFYLLSEDENGDLMADGYSQEFERGESRSFVLRVGNREHRATEYTVVVELQDRRAANGSTSVVAERELDRIRTGSVSHGETWSRTYDVTPTMTGQRLRLVFLLFRGAPPDDPTAENAYRTVQLQVNVSAP